MLDRLLELEARWQYGVGVSAFSPGFVVLSDWNDGRLNITYPMLFKLTNKNSDRMTHCGVLEFVADEGICYLPHWMMQNLLLEEGGLVQVESVNLQVATYSKFQPQSPDFLDITNPKAVLENALRNFACLTTGDVIAINYNEKVQYATPVCASFGWIPSI
ncbi:hypothetical protein llap_22326 [Limosa lapponica baueri]|uniref:Ubiquitin fusion degradation protein 1 n=1 Tax=Limosa lapponica baueri TaxID=1758121 RepID=A0A2I0T0N9_LIMLA|nr:hypothetical protein llap_22326 [Limosa lapponica baueri]